MELSLKYELASKPLHIYVEICAPDLKVGGRNLAVHSCGVEKRGLTEARHGRVVLAAGSPTL